MSYNIDEIIKYIELNIANISIRNYGELWKRYNVSKSKLYRDFKRVKGATPRGYLISLKMRLAKSFKSEDTALTIKEVVDKIGWDLSERQFADTFKLYYDITYGGKTINETDSCFDEDDSEIEFISDLYFLRDRSVLEEIIFRLVLLTGSYQIKDHGELSKMITFDLENSYWRFPMFTFEKKLIFVISFNRENFENLEMFTAFSRTAESDLLFVPNEKSTYLDMIYNVAINQEETVKKDILNSMFNWNELVEREKSIVFDNYYQHIFYKNAAVRLNRESAIYQKSQEIYSTLTNQFLAEYKGLLKTFALETEPLTQFIHAVRESDDYGIVTAINLLCPQNCDFFLPKKLDLLLQLAECAYMQHVEFKNYSFFFDESIIHKILSEIHITKIPSIIYAYFKAYQEANNEDEDETESTIDSNDILNVILNKH